jgi:hypothetical protein
MLNLKFKKIQVLMGSRSTASRLNSIKPLSLLGATVTLLPTVRGGGLYKV